MSKPIKCPSCNVNMETRSKRINEDFEYRAHVVCPSCDSRFCPVIRYNETSARRLTVKKTREWIAKLKTCESADKCGFRFVDIWKDKPNMNGDAFPYPPRAPGLKRRQLGGSGDVVIYGCGMPPSVVMYMASDPAVVYEHIPPTVTVTKITPEDLINGAGVTTTYADSANITPVYSAPGNGMALTFADMARQARGADAADSIIETCNKVIEEYGNEQDKE